MNERRRKLLKTAGIAVLPTVAGCAEGSNGGDAGSGDDEQPSTPEDGATTAEDTGTTTTTGTQTETESETETRTDTERDTPTETETQADSGTATSTETETPTQTETTTPSESVTLVINNVGVQAWEVTEDESGSVASLNENNPTLSFEVGQRYAVENDGWSAHPFALRGGDDTPLLSQSADGEFEGDGAVDWVDDGETFAFTFTEDLAAAVDHYVCTVHSGMRGDIEIS